MPTLPNMGLITPTLGADSGTWDDKINAALELVDAHDHTAGKGVAITVAALDIDANLPIGGFQLTSVGGVDFTAVTALAAGANVLFVNSADGELYWRTTGGANVKLTNGSSINTSLVGGIEGDYSSVGAELAYDDANQRYTFKDEDGLWARLASGPVRIFEYDTNESVYVEHAVATGLTAPYTVTWPAALPAAYGVMQIDNTGAVSLTDSLSFALGATDFYYEEQFLTLPAGLATDEGGGHTKFTGGGSITRGWTLGANPGKITWPLPVRHGDTIGTWTVYLDKNTGGSDEIEAQIYKVHGTDGAESTIGSGDANTTNAPNFITLGETVDEVVDAAYQYYLVVSPSESVTPAADVVYHARVGIYREAP